MSEEMNQYEPEYLQKIKQNSTHAISIGAIVMLMGLLAMGLPLITGLAFATVIGVLLILGGVAQLVFAMKARIGVFALLIGVLTLLVGIYTVGNPAVALETLTIVLAAYLVVAGVAEIFIAFRIRPVVGWGWSLSSGVISLVLGCFIWSQLPLSGVWLIGAFIGIRLFVNGLMLLVLGLTVRIGASG